MKHLGVAFGTKYLYFVSLAMAQGDAEGSSLAPVLDDVVRRWMQINADVRLRTHSWNPKDYGRYLILLDQWGTQLELRRDVVEELIFRSQISRDDSPLWGERWAAEAAGDATSRTDALDALHQLRDALSVLAGDSSAVDEAAPSLDAIARIIQLRSDE